MALAGGSLLPPTPSPLHAQLSHPVRKEQPLTQHPPSASPIPSHVILTEALGGGILVIPIFQKRKERGEIAEQRSWHLWGLLRLPLQPQLLPEGQLPAFSLGAPLGRWGCGLGARGDECLLLLLFHPLLLPLCCLAHLGEGKEGGCPQP